MADDAATAAAGAAAAIFAAASSLHATFHAFLTALAAALISGSVAAALTASMIGITPLFWSRSAVTTIAISFFAVFRALDLFKLAPEANASMSIPSRFVRPTASSFGSTAGGFTAAPAVPERARCPLDEAVDVVRVANGEIEDDPPREDDDARGGGGEDAAKAAAEEEEPEAVKCGRPGPRQSAVSSSSKASRTVPSLVEAAALIIARSVRLF